MFTGIIQGIGRVLRARSTAAGRQLVVEMGDLAEGVSVGGSVALDGACLTAVAVAGGEATFEVGAETLRRTTLRDFGPGRRVNIERPLAAGQPLGGHIVQGHVDGTGEVVRVPSGPEGGVFAFEVPDDLAAQMVPKGSVAVDGVSLTVSALEANRFEVYVIPHTLSATTLGERQPGHRVNIETDLIGKYVARFLGARSAGDITQGMLEEHGFL